MPFIFHLFELMLVNCFVVQRVQVLFGALNELVGLSVYLIQGCMVVDIDLKQE